MTPFVRAAYNYNMNDASEASGLECKDPTLTQQQFKDEVDINTLVERFGLTGEMPQLEKMPSYDDFSGIFDYQTAMNAVVAAREQFETLPADTRARFNNDPHRFHDYFADENNRAEAERMGLINKRPEPEQVGLPKVQPEQGDTPKTP